jgi:ABC-type Fe3+/spermidine/putrescine transport system ATPase subunit
MGSSLPLNLRLFVVDFVTHQHPFFLSLTKKRRLFRDGDIENSGPVTVIDHYEQPVKQFLASVLAGHSTLSPAKTQQIKKNR